MPVAGVLSFDEAIAVVLREAGNAPRSQTEVCSLGACRGRVLAEPVRADRDQPPFHRSTRDGFALHAEDARPGAQLTVVGQLRAGEIWGGDPVPLGQAIEIMTGAPVPEGLDAVLMVEHAQLDGSLLRLAEGRTLRTGENVVARGSEARAGQMVLPEGITLGPAEVALAASCGAFELRVFRRPTVSVVATGDELVEVSETPADQQIRNSNSYGLAALVEETGAEPVRLPIARDLRGDLRAALCRARESDLVLLSGGVSMGKYDFVEEILAEAGAQFFFTGVRMQPGKPVVFGRLPERDGAPARYFFGLPGNPISTQVTFHCFVAPLLRALRGAGVAGPQFALARLAEDVEGKPGLMRLLPARISGTRSSVEVQLVPWQGSGDLHANARANCYVALGPEQDRFRAGDVVPVMLR